MTTGLETGAELITDADVRKRIYEHMIDEALHKPWSNSWKYFHARHLLDEGRDISFVADVIGVSYRWLLNAKLIEIFPFKYKDRVGKIHEDWRYRNIARMPSV